METSKPAGGSSKIILELISYDRNNYERHDSLPIEEICKKLKPDEVNWINVDGLDDLSIIEKIQSYFNLHSLLVEDVVDDQRPKAEDYGDYLFFTLKMLYQIKGGDIDYEQISFVLGNNYLISFQEKEGDLFDGFRERIRLDQGRVRKKKTDYLLYRLIDIIVDSYYNVLDHISDQIDEIEENLHNDSSAKNFQKIQRLKKELIYLRRAVHPLRDALSVIMKAENGFIEEGNEHFFSDVYDHVIHVTDALDTYKDLISGLMDLHINTLNTRLNEVMKVLTVISTIFIPLTFIVGVYGMNFRFMPELEWRFGYYIIWGIMLLIVASMIWYFKFKKWF
ncbi:MAG TPA: magnesium/cobalt transporter CorA [Cyclobacteriaceae bacterium]|nr:magnesium/cobalt transporter CorA [Cyclobacteriaceae bacterium]